MSELLDKQFLHTEMVGMLIQEADLRGYKIKLLDGHVGSKTGHMKNSLHYIGLAQDIALFKDGEYLTKTEDYRELGEWWESLGGTWGGRWNDGNHMSLEHEGVK